MSQSIDDHSDSFFIATDDYTIVSGNGDPVSISVGSQFALIESIGIDQVKLKPIDSGINLQEIFLPRSVVENMSHQSAPKKPSQILRMAPQTTDFLVKEVNSQLLKSIFNYFQPFVIWKETWDQCKKVSEKGTKAIPITSRGQIPPTNKKRKPTTDTKDSTSSGREMNDQSENNKSKKRKNIKGQVVLKEINANVTSLDDGKGKAEKDIQTKASISNDPDIEILFRIMSSTRDYFCHLGCLTDTQYINHMYLNMKNLYEVCGVYLVMKTRQKEYLEKKEVKELDFKGDYYYFVDKWVDFTNLKPPGTVKRSRINARIENIIKDKHDSPDTRMSDYMSESFTIFAKLVHQLVGTRDLEWTEVTKYFDCYGITEKELFLRKRRGKDAEFKNGYVGLRKHWEEMETSKPEIIEIKTMQLKEMFNPEPFEVWNTLRKKLRDFNTCPYESKNIISILISTQKILSGAYYFMDAEGRYLIYLNLKYLYKLFNIKFKNEEKMEKFESQLKLTYKDKYYFYIWPKKGEKDKRITNKDHRRSISRKTVNEKIKGLITSGYEAINGGRPMDVASEYVFLFGYLLHLFEGDSNSITKYFSNYYISHLEHGTRIERSKTNSNLTEEYDELIRRMRHLQLGVNAS